jgi:cytochrome c
MMTTSPSRSTLPGTTSSNAPSVSSGESPLATEQASKVEALVVKAAALIDKRGTAALPELRKKDSEWFYGNTYLFIYDLNANVLLNPAFPKREGTNVGGEKDANGKLFNVAMIEVAGAKGAGWVDYVFPKPGQTEPARKLAYVKKVTIDGTSGLVASGF